MSKIAFAAVFAASALLAQAAAAQSPAQRDRAIAKLTDARDMSTGLPMNAPARTDSAMTAHGHAMARHESANDARDREIARLTDSRDMSTGFVK